MRRVLVIVVASITAVGALTAGAAVLAERWETARTRDLLQRLTDQEGHHSYLGVARLSFRSEEHGADMRVRLAGRGAERAMEVLERSHIGEEGGAGRHEHSEWRDRREGGRKKPEEPGSVPRYGRQTDGGLLGTSEDPGPGPGPRDDRSTEGGEPETSGDPGPGLGPRDGRSTGGEPETSGSGEPGRHRGPGGGPLRQFGADFLAWQHRIHSIDLLFQNYEVKRDGRESIAGRLAERVVVTPRWPGRPTRTMWIDPESGFLLAAETRMPEDGTVAVLRFEELEFDPEFSEGTFAAPAKRPEPAATDGEAPKKPAAGFNLFSGFTRANTNLDAARAEVKFRVLLPRSLPSGFALGETAVLRLGDASALHMVYTDGLATLSLFEYDLKQIPWLGFFKWGGKKKPEEAAPAPGEPVVRRFRMGPVAVLQYDVEGTNVALIGSIPSEEMVGMLETLGE